MTLVSANASQSVNAASATVPGNAAAATGVRSRPHVAASAVSIDDFDGKVYVDPRGHRLPYRLFSPSSAGRGEAAKEKFPLVLFLHGAGGRGTDNRGQLADQDAALVFVKRENQARWPVFMVAPQCPADQQWVDMPWSAATGKGAQPRQATWPMAAAISLVDELLRAHPEIDPSRLFVTGMSMGGFGTWDAAARNPTKWKAAVVVCGGYDQLAVGALVAAHLPLWAFHAADDGTVPVGRSREMIAALRARGETPRYTEYPAAAGYGHFSWRPAYADPQLLPWMFGPAKAAR